MASLISRAVSASKSTLAARSRIAIAQSLRAFSSRNQPGNIFYSPTHEYVKIEDNNVGVVSISCFAQEQLGEIVYCELPQVGAKFDKDAAFGTIESVKSANPVYMPVGGTVIETNGELANNVQIVNESAENEGWMIKIKIENPAELDTLLDKDAYAKKVAEEAH